MTAVATVPKEAALAVGSRLTHPIAVEIRKAAPQFAPFLPAGTDVEQVVAAVFLEVKRVEKLAECSADSIVSAASRLVSWGFDIGRTGYLVPFNGVATPVPGFKGFIEMILASGAASACEAREVYEGDAFEFAYGTDAFLRHVPAPMKTRGALKAFYVCWKVKFGYVKFDVMTVDEVEQIRKTYSRQWKNGPLPAWYGIKTVIRRSAKQLPQNPKLSRFFAAIAEDEESEFGKRVLSEETAEIVPTSDVPAIQAPAAPAPAETGEEATTPQRDLLITLSKSHIWTETERSALLKRIGKATKAQAATLIDNATRTIKERKQKEADDARARELEANAMGDTKDDELPF